MIFPIHRFCRHFSVADWPIKCWLFCASITGVLVLGLPHAAGEEPAHDSPTLSQHAIGILQQRCWACHGDQQQEGGLRLDSQEHLARGGDRGPIFQRDANGDVTPASLFLRSILRQDSELAMPPENPLPDNEQKVLLDWVASRTPWPFASADSSKWSEHAPTATDDAVFMNDAWHDPNNPVRKTFQDDRWRHWAYAARRMPAIPSVRQSDWPINPIDAFLLSRWESQGLQPNEEVDRRQWLRRVSFDLIGLPPTGNEVEAFLQDPSIDAYQRQVERLLRHPGHGEHWGRMWLDVVRYSDSNGFDWDEFRPQAWRYRDYVIAAFRDDKPFDQFVMEQLAGDEMFSGSPSTIDEQSAWIATGYLRMGPHDNAAPLFNEQARSRDELLTDLTETTASAFLGLTMSCCRCHDHKTDPLLQADHFRLRAFFAGVAFADDQPIDLHEDYQRIRARRDELSQSIEKLEQEKKGVDESLQEKSGAEEKADRKMEALTEEKQRIESQLASLKAEMPNYSHALLMRDQSKISDTHVLAQGDYRKPLEPVWPGFPAIWKPYKIPPASVARSESSGRRMALAKWIVHRDHPLTARVIVNRLWQNYFGEGLVATPNDFGVSGQRPTEPELLDWLAEELIRADWSLHRIHWLITTSRAYRLKSMASSQAASTTASPRKGLKRLTAEQLRDSVLFVSGQLLPTVGGPPIWPELPPDVLQANPALLDDNAEKTKGWYPSPTEQQSVRSIYWVQKRTVPIPYMETFDLPENSVSCGRRLQSIVAPQALAMINGNMIESASIAFADRIDQADPTDQVRQLYNFSLQRPPSPAELDACLEHLDQHGLIATARVILNLNEFVFLD